VPLEGNDNEGGSVYPTSNFLTGLTQHHFIIHETNRIKFLPNFFLENFSNAWRQTFCLWPVDGDMEEYHYGADEIA